MNELANAIKPKAYSYIRFSTPDQMKGDSFRRQLEAAEKYAALHGLDLDTKFNFHDLGVSAWQGKNRREGMLGEFLSLVRSGDIKPGSYLLVENLDRVSRENALDALDALKDIAREGVTVVTLNDGREYTHDSLRRNPIDLMVAVMMFMRANEESEVKARRLREAWSNKRQKAASEAKPLTGLCPGWLRLRADRSGFDINPERAEIVRRVFDLTLAGVGQHSIAERLNREGVPVFGRGKMWQRSYINKMLSDPAVIGRFTPHVTQRNGSRKVRVPTEPIEGYFPSVVEHEVFEKVSAMVTARPASKGGVVANMFAGLARCPDCDSTMTRINKGRKGGKPYLVCTRAKIGAGCTYKQVRLEDIVLAVRMQAERLWEGLPSPEQGLQARWEGLTNLRDAVNEQIGRVVEAIEEAGHSAALIRRLSTLEKERENVIEELDKVEQQITDTLTNRTQETLGKLVKAMQEEVAEPGRINATMRQLFSKVIVDYHRGELLFQWKHTDGEKTPVTFAMPEEG